MHLFTQPSLRANSEAVAHQQHAHHQLGIHGRSPGVAIERCQVSAQILQIQKSINTTQEVIGGNVVVEIERIKQWTLIAATFTHHLVALPLQVLRSKTLKMHSRSIVFQQNRPTAAGDERLLRGTLNAEPGARPGFWANSASRSVRRALAPSHAEAT